MSPKQNDKADDLVSDTSRPGKRTRTSPIGKPTRHGPYHPVQRKAHQRPPTDQDSELGQQTIDEAWTKYFAVMTSGSPEGSSFNQRDIAEEPFDTDDELPIDLEINAADAAEAKEMLSKLDESITTLESLNARLTLTETHLHQMSKPLSEHLERVELKLVEGE